MNAPSALLVETPDGSGQAVHPDVLYVPGGFLGFEYWMACTPYPFADDRLENPIVRVSRDGMDWRPFPGAPDPLVEAPTGAGWHHADTDLVLDGERLYLFFITTRVGAGDTIVSWVSSADAVHWDPPGALVTGHWIVSPSVVVDRQGIWQLWHVVHDGLARPRHSELRRRQGTSVQSLGQAGAADERCSLDIPGHVVWHLDVVGGDDGFEALVTAFPRGADPSRSRLFHARSHDGVHFTVLAPAPLLSPSWLGWDNRMIYRSTLAKRGPGDYRIWYSGASWGMRCGIGLLEGPAHRLVPVRPRPGAPATPPGRKLREDAVGLAKYLVSRCLPPRLLARGLELRRRLWRSRDP